MQTAQWTMAAWQIIASEEVKFCEGSLTLLHGGQALLLVLLKYSKALRTKFQVQKSKVKNV